MRAAGDIPEPPANAAVVGCGVIGAAWIARMRLRGVDVRAFDPMPNAASVIESVTSDAVRAWDDLGLPTDRLGGLTMCSSIDAADLKAKFDSCILSSGKRIALRNIFDTVGPKFNAVFDDDI